MSILFTYKYQKMLRVLSKKLVFTASLLNVQHKGIVWRCSDKPASSLVDLDKSLNRMPITLSGHLDNIMDDSFDSKNAKGHFAVSWLRQLGI